MPDDQEYSYEAGPPAFLEDKGWQQMRNLLDLHMPQAEPGLPGRLRLLSWLVPAAALLLFTLPTRTHDVQQRLQQNSRDQVFVSSIHQPSPIDTIVHFTENSQQHSGQVRNEQAGKTGNPENKEEDKNEVSSLKYLQAAIAGGQGFQYLSNEFLVQPGNPSTYQPIHLPGNERSKTGNAADGEHNRANNKTAQHFGLSVELNKTITGHTTEAKDLFYKIPVYPSLRATWAFSKMLGLSTGVSAFSPGNFQHPQTQETTLTYQASLGVIRGKETVQQVYYWKIPLLLDVQVAKHVTVSAGADFAFLQKVLVKREESYDNVNSTPVPEPSSVSDTYLLRASAVGNSSLAQSYDVRRFDPRWTVGAQYHLNRFYAGVQYGQSFKPAVSYKNFPQQKSRNKVVTFTVGFNLFKK